MTNNFKNLDVWKTSLELTVNIYKLTSKLPKTEAYGLSDQMKRSAISIPSNIAEGQKRISKAESAHFCSIALGSAAELETQLYIIQKVYKYDVANELNRCIEISKMLSGLYKHLKPRG